MTTRYDEGESNGSRDLPCCILMLCTCIRRCTFFAGSNDTYTKAVPILNSNKHYSCKLLCANLHDRCNDKLDCILISPT